MLFLLFLYNLLIRKHLSLVQQKLCVQGTSEGTKIVQALFILLESESDVVDGVVAVVDTDDATLRGDIYSTEVSFIWTIEHKSMTAKLSPNLAV